METAYILIIMMSHTGEQRLAFETKPEAMAALADIEPKIGARFSNDPDLRRHRVVSADGETVVCMEHVVSARVLDMAEFRRLTKFERDARLAEATQINATLAHAIAAVIKTPAA